MSSVFGVRADFDMDVSHILPQSVLATIILIVAMVGVRRSKACAVNEVGLLCSMAVATLSGVGSGLLSLDQKL